MIPAWHASLNRAKEALEDMIDGGTECVGHDTRITGVIAWIDDAIRETQPEAVESDLPNAIWLAKFCHDAYERLAPQYGYETRQDTRTFDHESPNGRLMAAVFEELRATLLPSHPAAQGDGKESK